MKLKPVQVVGLVAIVVFGALLVVQLTRPSEREVMAERLAALPSPAAMLAVDAPVVAPPVVEAPVETVQEPVIAGASVDSDDGMPGSQAAKDDLYCWAVLGEHFVVRVKTHPEEAIPLVDIAKRLEAAGVGKLDAEGVTQRDKWASLTVAYADKARADYKRNTLRIPVEACVARDPGPSPRLGGG